MEFYIPKALDIETLLQQHPPVIKGFDKWKLLYFIHIVSYLPSVSKKLRHEESGYVNLNSTKLQQVVPNYSAYIEYLIENKILEVNSRYLPGSFSKSYRLTLQYVSSGLVPLEVGNAEFARIAKKNTGQSPEELKRVSTEYIHLVRQFKGLEYDYSAATKYIEAMRFETRKSHPNSDIRYENERIREIEINNLLLRDKEYQCKVDNTSGRFHSILTRLKREFRHFLTFKGEPLVSLDIKSSQPFLAQRLLMPQFWLQPAGSGKRKSGRKKQLSAEALIRADYTSNVIQSFLWGRLEDIMASIALNWGIKLEDIEGRITRDLRDTLRKVGDTSPMLVSKAQSTDLQSIQHFCHLVNQHDIYEHILGLIISKLSTDKAFHELYKDSPFSLTRDSMKTLVLRGMYSPSRSNVPNSKLIHQIFREEFPGVEAIFDNIKNINPKQYRVLALLLQAIESEVLLNRVCPKIVSVNKNIPFFTIHDSILTIPKYKDIVKSILETEFEKAIGIKPTIKEEGYAVSDMNPIPAVLAKENEIFVSLEDILDEELLFGDTLEC